MDATQEYSILQASMQLVRDDINARSIEDFIQLQPSKGGLYCCPICHSGEKAHGTGALKLYDNGRRVMCHAAAKCFSEHGEDTSGALKRIWGCTDYEMMQRAGYDVQRYKQRVQNGYKPTEKPEPKPAEPAADYSEYYKQVQANLENPNSKEGYLYLAGRGLNISVIRAYGIGYDPNWRSPTAIKNGKNPPASPRIIIPSSNHHYVARDIRPGVKDYCKMNEGSPDIFNANALYNTDGKPVFVVEGAIDALSILTTGEYAVALNSTSNDSKLLAMLENKQTKNALILCLDNDTSGIECRKRIELRLQELGIPYAVKDICCGQHDPNDALCAKPGEFIKAVVEAASSQQPGRRMVDTFLQVFKSDRYKPIPTGIKPLDNMIHGGFIPQTLVMIGAAPGIGKTAFSQQLFEGMAAQGRNVLYFNFEMSTEQLIARSVSRIAHVKHGATMAAVDVMQGYAWTESQEWIVRSTLDEYGKTIAPHIAYNPGHTRAELSAVLEQMNAAAERAQKAGIPAPFVVIDYLQLLRGEQGEDSQNVVKRACDYFKDYAVKYQTVVYAILAFGRAANKAGKVSQDSGRDSSAIEYGADLMLALNYAKVEEMAEGADQNSIDAAREREADKPVKEYVLKATKNRLQGGTGKINLKFEGKYSLFVPDDWSTNPVQVELPKGWQSEKPKIHL